MAQRAFGYTVDYEPLDEEVEALHTMRKQLVEGLTFADIADNLNSSGVRPTRGGSWRDGTVNRLLRSPRFIGMRARQADGVLVPGPHPAIFTQEEWDEMQAAMATPERQRYAPKHPSRHKALLTGGLLRCGLCGTSMQVTYQGEGRQPTYRCPAKDGGCGKVKMSQPMADADIEELIMLRLASPELMTPVFARARRETAAKAERKMGELEDRLAELGHEYAAGTVDIATVKAATTDVRARLAVLKKAAGRDDILGSLPEPRLSAVAAWWTTANIDQRRAATRVFIDRIDVAPTKQGRRTTAMDRLTIHWRSD